VISRRYTACDCRYEWLKDGKHLNVAIPLDGAMFRRRAGTGTILIDPASTAALEGSYQCVAKNQFGAAVTDLAVVRMAGALLKISRLRPRCRHPGRTRPNNVVWRPLVATPTGELDETYASSLILAYSVHYPKTLRHLQSRRYITYCIAIRVGPSHGHR